VLSLVVKAGTFYQDSLQLKQSMPTLNSAHISLPEQWFDNYVCPANRKGGRDFQIVDVPRGESP